MHTSKSKNIASIAVKKLHTDRPMVRLQRDWARSRVYKLMKEIKQKKAGGKGWKFLASNPKNFEDNYLNPRGLHVYNY